MEFKKQLSVEKPIVKGYNFFKSGKVLGLYSKSENGLVSVFLILGVQLLINLINSETCLTDFRLKLIPRGCMPSFLF